MSGTRYERRKIARERGEEWIEKHLRGISWRRGRALTRTQRFAKWIRGERAATMLGLLLILASGCAVPRSTTEIPPAVAIALAGQDPSHLPDVAWTAAPVRIEQKWFSRTIGFQVDRGPDGSHFVDLTATSDDSNALEARRSDNERATDIVGSLVGAFQQGLALAAQAYATGLPAAAEPAAPIAAPSAAPPAPAPVAPSGDEPIVDAMSNEALNRSVAEIVERLRALEDRAAPEVVEVVPEAEEQP